MNKKLKSLDFWTEKFSEKTAQIFIDRKLIPVNLIYWTDDDIANLVNDENIYQKIIALRNKIIVKKDIWFKKEIDDAEKIEPIPKKPDKELAEAPGKELSMDEEVSEPKSKEIGMEDESKDEEEDDCKDVSEDENKLEIIQRMPREELRQETPRSGTRVVKKLSIKDIKIPQFSNNIKFLQDVDAILKIEQAEDSWFEVLIKSIPWESGGSLLYEHKQLIIDLEWQSARKKIIEILEPNRSEE